MARKAKIKREDLFEAALALVDRDGLEALTMRRLGEALGVEAMSLYRHVPHKEALLDGLQEAVLHRMRRPRPRGRWDEDLRALARAFRDLLRAHPHTLPLFATRPAVAEGSLELVELGLSLLADAFDRPRQRIHALQTVIAFVVGQAIAHFTPSATAGPAYAELSADRFPQLAAAAPVLARYSFEREFEFGLDVLLEGLRQVAAARDGGPRS